MRKTVITILSILALSGNGCIHHPEIQQGNVFTKEMVDSLRVGMSKKQVQFVLGTPLVNNPFNPNRWEYVYFLKAKKKNKKQKLTLYFNDDKLNKIEGSYVPEEAIE